MRPWHGATAQIRKHSRGQPQGSTVDTWTDEQWLDYITEEAVDERPVDPSKFSSDVLDRGHVGMRLKDFVAMAAAINGDLRPAHVLALRLYSSSVFKTINDSLRQGCSTDRKHPYPTTVVYLVDAIKKLRAAPGGHPPVLWRGMRGLDVDHEFMTRGGTEKGFMSTTSDRAVAEEYATRGAPSFSLLFQVHVRNYLICGADISFASCFPTEKEYLYPPNMLLETTTTYRVPVGLQRNSSRGEGLTGNGVAGGAAEQGVKVVEVEPTYSV